MDVALEASLIAALLEAANNHSFPELWRMRAELEIRMDELVEARSHAQPGAIASQSLETLMRIDARFCDEVVLAISAEACSVANRRLQDIIATTVDTAPTDEQKRTLRDELEPLIASIPRLPVNEDWKEAIKRAGGALAALQSGDMYVRDYAIGILACEGMGSGDVAVLRLLAELTLNEAEPTELRFSAYDALFVIAGKHPVEWPMTKIMSMSLTDRDRRAYKASGGWLGDVDWQFVRSLMGQRTGPGSISRGSDAE